MTEAIFGILFVAGLVMTAPDFQWQPLLAIGIATNVLVPLVFYPMSKTVWVAFDLYMHPAGTSPSGAFNLSRRDGPRR